MSTAKCRIPQDVLGPHHFFYDRKQAAVVDPNAALSELKHKVNLAKLPVRW